MFLLFLYQRVHRAAQLQLEAATAGDLDALESHGKEREEATRLLCRTLDERRRAHAGPMSAAARRRIHAITTRTLDIDGRIRDRLLASLESHARDLQRT